VVNDGEKEILITPANLGEYVGKPVFSSDKMYAQTPVRMPRTQNLFQKPN
jgi:hypothetical protein